MYKHIIVCYEIIDIDLRLGNYQKSATIIKVYLLQKVTYMFSRGYGSI